MQFFYVNEQVHVLPSKQDKNNAGANTLVHTTFQTLPHINAISYPHIPYVLSLSDHEPNFDFTNFHLGCILKKKMLSIIFYYLFYRHTKEMIQKLESAGLGYHVSADDTEDKLGMMK